MLDSVALLHFTLPEASDRMGGSKGSQQQPASRSLILLQTDSESAVPAFTPAVVLKEHDRRAEKLREEIVTDYMSI